MDSSFENQAYKPVLWAETIFFVISLKSKLFIRFSWSKPFVYIQNQPSTGPG